MNGSSGQLQPEFPAARERSALDVLLRCFVAEIGAETGMVLGRNAENETRVDAIWGLGGVEPSAPWITGSLLGRAFEADAALIESKYDVGTPSPRSDQATDQTTHARGSASAAVAAPIIGAQGRHGALYAGFAGAPAISAEALAWTADSYARTAALCMDGSDGLAATLLDSVRDRLTGCLSHGGVLDATKIEIQRAKRQRHRLACCFVDLDRFKKMNDQEGHLVGNQVLVAVGQSLLDGARPYDSVGRFGGDEFVIVLPYLGAAQARRVAERARARVTVAATSVTGTPIFASAGVAEWRQSDSPLELLDGADRALGEAKESGGATTVLARSGGREDRVAELARSLLRIGRSRAPAERQYP